MQAILLIPELCSKDRHTMPRGLYLLDGKEQIRKLRLRLFSGHGVCEQDIWQKLE